MKLLKPLLIGLLPATFSVLSWPLEPVQAGETCNYLNHQIFMAQAFLNENQVWVSEGWWPLEPGECVVYSDNASTYFKISEDQSAPRPTLPGTTKTDLWIVHDRDRVYQAEQAGVCSGQEGWMETFIQVGAKQELLKE